LETTKFLLDSEVPIEGNRSRGRALEEALRVAHERLGLPYQDTSEIYNGIIAFIPLNKKPASGSVPDGFCFNNLHEAKNWRFLRYYLDKSKAKSEIVERGLNYPSHTKHLWITRPKWQRGTKQYLIGCGWIIHELPEVVTQVNLMDAVSWIVKELKVVYGLVREGMLNMDYNMDCRVLNLGCNLGYGTSNELSKGKPPPNQLYSNQFLHEKLGDTINNGIDLHNNGRLMSQYLLSSNTKRRKVDSSFVYAVWHSTTLVGSLSTLQRSRRKGSCMVLFLYRHCITPCSYPSNIPVLTIQSKPPITRSIPTPIIIRDQYYASYYTTINPML